MTVSVTDIFTATVVFTATNMDDVFLLLAFFADRRYRAAHVVAGQYLGIAVLFAVSVAASLVSVIFAPPWLGLLGLIPLALGIKAFFDSDDDAASPTMTNRRDTILSVASITIANGGDNVGVYTPLFATLSLTQIAVTGIVFSVLIAAWCELARRMVAHQTWGPAIRRLIAPLLPFVLIALGIWIIVKMGTWEAVVNHL